jgi:hypothetical protein
MWNCGTWRRWLPSSRRARSGGRAARLHTVDDQSADRRVGEIRWRPGVRAAGRSPAGTDHAARRRGPRTGTRPGEGRGAGRCRRAVQGRRGPDRHGHVPERHTPEEPTLTGGRRFTSHPARRPTERYDRPVREPLHPFKSAVQNSSGVTSGWPARWRLRRRCRWRGSRVAIGCVRPASAGTSRGWAMVAAGGC